MSRRMRMGMVVLYLLVMPFSSATDVHVWAKVAVPDFPTQDPIGATLAFREIPCGMFASRVSLNNMFCYTAANMSCVFYRFPPAAAPYVCSEVFNNCQLGSTTCYRKIPPGDAFFGIGTKVFPPGSLGAKIVATKVYDLPSLSEWILAFPPGHAIQLDFDSFDLTNCGCSCAFFEIRDLDTNDLIDNHQYCGDTITNPIILKNPRVKIVFMTDGSKKLPGFSMLFRAFEAYYCVPEITVVTDPSGEVVSKDVLAQPMNCRWQLNMPSGKVLKITFIEFDLGACCPCATLTLIDAAFTSKALAGGSLCGSTLPEDIPVTISRNVDIILSTDGSATLPGFKIQFEAIPEPTTHLCVGSQVVTDASGYLRPTNAFLYQNGMSCSWRLQVATGSQVRVHVMWFQTEPTHDTLTVQDVATSDTFGGPFSGPIHPAPMTASGNEMLLSFSTDSSVLDYGFQIYFYTI